MIIGEIFSIYPLLNQINLYLSIVADQLKFYLETMK
jgi:hypothetical protein